MPEYFPNNYKEFRSVNAPVQYDFYRYREKLNNNVCCGSLAGSGKRFRAEGSYSIALYRVIAIACGKYVAIRWRGRVPAGFP